MLAQQAPLSAQDNALLIRALRQGGKYTKEIYARLCTGNEGLLYKYAQRYQDRGVPQADLMQEGYLGLFTAIEQFDLVRGTCFSTYATWWIRQKMLRALPEQGRVIRFSSDTYQNIQRLKRTFTELWQEEGRKPSLQEVAKRADLSLERVQQLLHYDAPILSLNAPFHREEHEASTWEDLLADGDEHPEEQALNRVMSEQIEQIFRTAGLTDREQMVVRRCVLDDEQQVDLASEFQLSRERIRQIRQQALDKLKAVPNIALLLRP